MTPMTLSSVLVVLAIQASGALGARLVTTVSTSCTWNGHTFAQGTTYKPDPCTWCHCDGGRAMCAVADCAFPSCVDLVHDPTQCCPTCPNGQNCRAPDGSIVPAGQEVTISDGRQCRCSGSGFFMQHEAICSVV